MTDIDWANPAEAALALARIVSTWRSHLQRAESSRARAAALRSSGSPAPAGVSADEWRSAPDLLGAQAAEWEAAAADARQAFRDAVASAVAGGRLTRGQAAALTAADTLGAADDAVAALKRDLF